MAMAQQTRLPGVSAEVNYIRNPPVAPGDKLRMVTEEESRSSMETLPGRPMWITDARGLARDLEREGFTLAAHHSAVPDFDLIQGDPAVDALYIEEMTAFLTEFLGADRVIMLGGGKKRYGEGASGDKFDDLPNAKPARYPHADNTNESVQGLLDLLDQFIEDLDPAEFSRWGFYHMWRAVSGPPQDFPLAVCDARTVRPEDEVTVTAVTLERGSGEIVHDTTGYLHNTDHRWNFFSDMTPDEVLVFKGHDSDPARVQRVPHTAFTDPNCPPGVPTRASVEMRAIALFR